MTGTTFDPITAILAVVTVAVSVAVTIRRRKREGPAKWNPRPPNAHERIIAGIWLAAFIVAVVNDYAGWQLFEGYDRWVLGALFFAGLFLVARLPGVTRTK